MTPDFQQLMRDATRLTGSGRLQEATLAIQRALAAAGAGVPPPAPAGLLDPTVIDVEAVVVSGDVRHDASADGSGAGNGDGNGVGNGDASSPAARAAESAGVRAGSGRFSAGSHSEGGLTREYKLYLPQVSRTASTSGLPLVVMLHGCTQGPDDFSAGTGMNALADEIGFAVLYPAQARDANPGRCWNWFKHNHQQRGRGEPAVLAGMTRAVMAEHGLDSRRVYVAGLSAGGAMAAVVAQAYPDLFAAVGVHSGLPTGAAKDMMSALSAMKDGPGSRAARSSTPPLIVFHADDDGTVSPLNADALLAAALAGRADTVTGTATTATTATTPQTSTGVTQRGRHFTRTRHQTADGRCIAEDWRLHGGGHAWAGGQAAGTYTDPAGPDASREMLRFFLQHAKAD